MGRWWNVGTGILETSCGDYVVEVSKFETPSGSHPTITVEYHDEPITLRWRKGGRRRSIIPSRPRLVRLLDSAHVPFIITQNCALDLLSEALVRIFKDHALHLARVRSLRRRRSRPTSLTTLQLPSVVLTISCSSEDEGMEDYMEEDDPELEEEEEEPKEEEDPEEEVDPEEDPEEEVDPEEDREEEVDPEEDPEEEVDPEEDPEEEVDPKEEDPEEEDPEEEEI